MIRSVYAKWLWDSRRSLLGWTLAIVLVGCGYAAFWPTIDDPEIAALIENYPTALLEAINYTNITTPDGYLSATVYGLVVAVLMVVFSVTAGTRIVAGEEEAGTLDLTLSYPVSRPSLAWQRVGAFATAVMVILAVFLVAMLALSVPAQYDSIPLSRFAAMHLHLAAFAWLFGMLAFALGAATGKRAIAWGLTGAVAVLAYAAGGVIPQVEGLEWVRDYSAFTWLTGSAPLTDGADGSDIAVMLGLGAAFAVLGTVAFQRRDLGT